MEGCEESGWTSNLLQLMDVGVPDRPAKAQTHASALALYVNQTGPLQLAEMMRDSGRANTAVRLQAAAKQTILRSDLLQDGETSWIRQGSCDCLKLFLRQDFLRSSRESHHVRVDG